MQVVLATLATLAPSVVTSLQPFSSALLVAVALLCCAGGWCCGLGWGLLIGVTLPAGCGRLLTSLLRALTLAVWRAAHSEVAAAGTPAFATCAAGRRPRFLPKRL